MDTVTPSLEFNPERQYRREGAVITVYRIISVSALMDKIVCDEATPVAKIQCASDEEASMLMNDLYYGEYTGA